MYVLNLLKMQFYLLLGHFDCHFTLVLAESGYKVIHLKFETAFFYVATIVTHVKIKNI